ncbi:teichuronic acid biosynthesis glycosyltransferase TuaG [Chitinophaga sp. W3I9]|uniref:glycosyltransferase family 2 protein n=1 Tax=unclassified Chitinophaga TaxID=2619133 RepID=UPI00352672B8
MVNQAKISVIIPFYTNVDWLAQAIDSVLAQTYPHYEILVINDGSPEDDTYFLMQYETKIKYIKTKNAGPASARNLGIEMAEGEYIAFLDSDDLWMPEKLEVQLNAMIAENAVWSHTSYTSFYDGSEADYKLVDISDFSGEVFKRGLLSTPIATPCVMIRAKYLKENPACRFSNVMRHGQDWYLWIMMARLFPLLAIPASLTRVRLRGANAALRARVQIKSKAQLWTLFNNNNAIKPELQTLKPGVRFSYKFCKAGSSLIDFTEKYFIKNRKTLEFMSKVVYLTPYLILKMYSLNYKN